MYSAGRKPTIEEIKRELRKLQDMFGIVDDPVEENDPPDIVEHTTYWNRDGIA